MDMFRSRQLRHTAQFTVLGLTETWHDTDCAAFGRFRDAGFSVVDRGRPRVRDDFSVNHGGVAVVTAPRGGFRGYAGYAAASPIDWMHFL